jgi:glycosyltransferase involved in cell wall biosynthesis
MRVADARRPAPAPAPPPAEAPRPLRIIHVFRSPLGGLFRHVVDLAEAQYTAGHAVGILCDSTSGNGNEIPVFERLRPKLALGLTQVPMTRSISPSDVSAAWRLAKQVLPLAPDILHGHGAKGGAQARIIGALMRRRKSTVARIYTPHGGSLHFDRSSIGGRVYLAAERWLAKRTDGFIFVSAFERDAFLAKVGATEKPMAIVHNGLRPEEFAPVMHGAGARDFLFLGELRDLKGPDVFIGALALLKHRHGKAPTAAIVGSGPDEQKYRTVVSELGLGDTTEFFSARPAREAFALAKTIVVPSRAESMPYVVLEAIAAGMPMVASRVGGIPEIVGGDASQLVEPGNAVALADGLDRVLTAPGAALAAAAALNIRLRSTFTVEEMAAGVERLYRRALGH